MKVAGPSVSGPGRFEHTDLRTVESATPDLVIPGIVYRGWPTLIAGPTGSGKSMLAAAFAMEGVRAHLRIGHWDEEMGGSATALRYRSLGADDSMFDNGVGRPSGIRYHEWQSLTISDANAFARHVVEVDGSDVVIFDPLADHLIAAGMEENANDDVTRWFGEFPQFLTQVGVASLILDGMPHDGGHARGASQKAYKAALVYLVDVLDPPRKDHVGRVRLTCVKDRFGEVGQGSTLTFALGGDGNGAITFRRLPDGEKPAQGVDRRSSAIELVADAVVDIVRDRAEAGLPDLSMRQILDRLPPGYGTTLTMEGIRRAATDPMRPVIAYDGPRNARLHKYAPPPRTASGAVPERSQVDAVRNGPSTVPPFLPLEETVDRETVDDDSFIEDFDG